MTTKRQTDWDYNIIQLAENQRNQQIRQIAFQRDKQGKEFVECNLCGKSGWAGDKGFTSAPIIACDDCL